MSTPTSTSPVQHDPSQPAHSPAKRIYPSKMSRTALLALCEAEGVVVDTRKLKSNKEINQHRNAVLKARKAEARLQQKKNSSSSASSASSTSSDKRSTAPVATANSASGRAGPAATVRGDAGEVEEEADDADEEKEPSDFDDVLAAAARADVDLDLKMQQLMRVAVDDDTSNRQQAANARRDAAVAKARNPSQVHVEESVLRIYAAWLYVCSGDEEFAFEDDILDEHAATLFLEFTSTRSQYTRQGKLDKNKRVDGSTFDKTWSMLVRVRKAQVAHAACSSPPVNLDLVRPFNTPGLTNYRIMLHSQTTVYARDTAAKNTRKNTFLEYAAWDSERCAGISEATMRKSQGPTLLRTHLMFTWTLQTLNRLDDLVLTRLAYLEYTVLVMNAQNGERVPVITAQQFEGKTRKKKGSKPHFAVIAPHKDPRLCAIGSLSAYLYFLFDVQRLMEDHKRSGRVWDWEDPASWRLVYLMAAVRNATKYLAKTTLTRSYTLLFEQMAIEMGKKGHLGRVIGSWLMEGLGCTADQISRTGDWTGDIQQNVYACPVPRQGVRTAAGFGSSESMLYPRLQVKVPDELLSAVFPWVDEELAKPVESQTRSFLSMLVSLRQHFVIHFAEWYKREPSCVLFDTWDIFRGPDNAFVAFFQEYPRLLAIEEDKLLCSEQYLRVIADEAVRGELMMLKMQCGGLRELLLEMRKRMQDDDEPPEPRQKRRLFAETGTSSPPPGASLGSSSQFLSRSNPAQFARASPTPSSPPSSVSRLLPAFELSTPSISPSSISPSSASPHTTARSPTTTADNASSAPAFGSHSHAATPASTPRHSASPPALLLHTTPGRSRPPLDGPSPSPHRLRILPSTQPAQLPPDSPYDFLLPNPLAFAAPASGPLSAQPPAFPIFLQPVDWSAILTAVKQPSYLFDTYGPRSLKEYASLFDLWTHHTTGSLAAGEETTVQGRVPPIQELERRFPTKGKAGQKWAEKLASAPRQRLRMFRLVVEAIKARMTGSVPAHQAIEALAAECGVTAVQVPAIGRILSERSAAQNPRGKGKECAEGRASE
ncbi:hypothetical protein JCM11641_002166 [Rhodosporidiobolus odoratus]